MTTYERGASCGKGQHTWVQHENYAKCSVCGASRTTRHAPQGGTSDEYFGRQRYHQERNQQWDDFLRRVRNRGPDPHEVLGVPHDATQDDIKAAYRRLAKQWHPDVTTEDKKVAEEKFKAVANAYHALRRE